jgi:hypothetical protein
MTYITSFKNIGSAIRKVIEGESHTRSQHRDLVGLLFFSEQGKLAKNTSRLLTSFNDLSFITSCTIIFDLS